MLLTSIGRLCRSDIMQSLLPFIPMRDDAMTGDRLIIGRADFSSDIFGCAPTITASGHFALRSDNLPTPGPCVFLIACR